jgi:nitroreductase/SAM-dependent methyltransferase
MMEPTGGQVQGDRQNKRVSLGIRRTAVVPGERRVAAMSTTVTPVLPETTARADGPPPMSVGDAIRTRRTIRSWLPDQPVAEALINELLEAALWAPSACNMQLWDFVVVTDEATRQQLEDAVPFANQAPVLIFVCYNTRFSEGSFAHIQGASASIMNMLLQGHGLGLGGFWQATIHDRAKLHTVLRLPEDVEVLATVLFGYPAEQPGAPARRDPSHMTHWQQYHPRPRLPSSPNPRDWTLAQIADYQQARIRAGPKYNKPIRSEFEVVTRFGQEALVAELTRTDGARCGAGQSSQRQENPHVWLDLLPCTGLYLEHLMPAAPDAAVHFIELTEQTTQFAQRRLPRPAQSHHYDGRIDLPDASVDVATCIFRLENLPPPERLRLLTEAHRVLRPGGALILAHISRRSYFALMQPIRWLLGRRDVQYVLGTDPSLGPFVPLAPHDVVRGLANVGFRRERGASHFPLPPEDEARHRVRALRPPLSYAQYPVQTLYSLTRPLHRLLEPWSKLQLAVYRK